MPEARVASVQDLQNGEMKTVKVGDVEVLLSRVDGRYHACGAHCTHYGAPLAGGALRGTMVVCPWHHARFDVTTGALADAPALDRLAKYEVRIDGDDVYVSVPAGAANTPAGAAYAESAGEPTATASRDFDAEPTTCVIIGAGAAAQAAAEAMREAGFKGRVIMLTRETSPPYDRTQLSKGYMAGKATDADLPLRDTDFHQRFGIELQLDSRVARLDTGNHTIHFENAEPLGYDRLLIASGGVPRQLDVPGADLEGVHLLRSWRDGRELAEAASRAERVVIVGSSFIGTEVAASLRQRGADVAVVSVEEVPFQKSFGKQVGRVFQDLHEDNGVRFHMGTGVERIEKEGEGLALLTTDGERLECDLVLVAIGVDPATDFVEGLDMADDGSVVVDDHLRAAEGVYAAGDIAQFPDWRTGGQIRIEHWRLAQQHGRVAGLNMAGEEVPYRGIPFFWTGQFGVGLRYLGFVREWDEIVIDGSLDDRKFIAYYIADGRIAAAAGVGRDREMAALHALMLAEQGPSPQEVQAGYNPLAVLAV